jgi:hypothetical protein
VTNGDTAINGAFQPNNRAKLSSASNTIHMTTARQTKPTMLRKCATSGSRPVVGSTTGSVSKLSFKA